MVMAGSKIVLVDPRWGGRNEDRQACLDGFTSYAEPKHYGYKPVLKQMVTGDIVFSSPTGRVGIECKTIADLCTSHRLGRLDDELYRLQREFAVPCLLITEHCGSEADIPVDLGWPWSAVDNLLLGRQLRGIHVVHCGTMPIAARVIRMDQYLERLSHKQIIRPKQRHFPAMGKLTERAEVLYSLFQRVGSVRDKAKIAEKLAAAYALSDVMQWGPAAWQEQGFTKLMSLRLAEFTRSTA